MIEFTVGLPMFESIDIYWLALEGLCRQQDIDFEWELVIMEELSCAVGLDRINEYTDRLNNVGCVEIKHYTLKQWTPLSIKWIKMINRSNPDSNYFMLQACDCFSQPYRLKETYDIFKNTGADWVQSPKGYFYDIGSKTTALFDSNYPEYIYPCKLNMALKTSLLRNIVPDSLARGIDSWLYKKATETKRSNLITVDNTSVNWVSGFDSNGANRVSRRRTHRITQLVPPFFKTDDSVRNHIDNKIIDELDKIVVKGKRFV